ncbi:hypothetical protein F5Y06DRAFT_144693 [Hypoxylon sp. FL0890]|nr:hypothetical protein F5Y06DRAFT_144693 [Hypoxylon sp. FL0890]
MDDGMNKKITKRNKKKEPPAPAPVVISNSNRILNPPFPPYFLGPIQVKFPAATPFVRHITRSTTTLPRAGTRVTAPGRLPLSTAEEHYSNPPPASLSHVEGDELFRCERTRSSRPHFELLRLTREIGSAASGCRLPSPPEESLRLFPPNTIAIAMCAQTSHRQSPTVHTVPYCAAKEKEERKLNFSGNLVAPYVLWVSYMPVCLFGKGGYVCVCVCACR